MFLHDPQPPCRPRLHGRRGRRVVAGLGALWLEPRPGRGRPHARGGARPARRRPLRDGLRRQALHREPVLRPVRLGAGHEAGGAHASSRRRPASTPRATSTRSSWSGTPGAAKGSPGLALALGRFDLYKIGRALETEGKVNGHNVAGVYGATSSRRRSARSVALAFLDETALLFGPRAEVEAAVTSRAAGRDPAQEEHDAHGPRREGAARVHLLDGRRPEPARRDADLRPGARRLRRRGDDRACPRCRPDRHRRPRPAGLARASPARRRTSSRRRTWPTWCAASSR